MYFEEFEACIAARLDLHKWEKGLYERDFKERVIAWYQLHQMIESHSSDAQIEASKKAAKKAGKKK